LASFEQHIARAKYNFLHLENLNKLLPESVDWQVTTCFYIAVHLVNAHLAKMSDLHYRTHSEVENVLNPLGLYPHRLDEECFKAYQKLKNLSRRSRYMCHDALGTNNNEGVSTTHKHLRKACINLDILLIYFSNKYVIDIPAVSIMCKEFSSKSDKLTFIKNSLAAN
jgi:hypothetical protein